MGCLKLHILDEQYKRTELKVSYGNKKLTSDFAFENVRRITLYAYCLNNPIIFIDPDGREVRLSNLTDKQHQKAVQNMLETKNGRAFIGRYMSEGQTIKLGEKTYSFNSTGDRAKDVLFIQSADAKAMGNRNGCAYTYTKQNKEISEITDPLNVNLREGVFSRIFLKVGLDEKQATGTLGHEAFVHTDRKADLLNEMDAKINNGNYSRREYVEDFYLLPRGDIDHKALGKGTIFKYENYLNQLSNNKKDNFYLNYYKKEVERYGK